MKKLTISGITLGAMAFALMGFAGAASAAPSPTMSAFGHSVEAAPDCNAQAGGLTLGYLCD